MRSWILHHRFIVLLIGATILAGYGHQLYGQVVSHHHADCASHGECQGDSDEPHSSEDSPSGDDCHCQQCHLAAATVEFAAPLTFTIAVSILDHQSHLRGPAAALPPLDRPPIRV